MKFVLKTLATALVIGLALPCTSAAQGGGASSTGTIQGRVADQQRRRAARRDRDRDEPVDDRRADAGHERKRPVSISGRAAGRV